MREAHICGAMTTSIVNSVAPSSCANALIRLPARTSGAMAQVESRFALLEPPDYLIYLAMGICVNPADPAYIAVACGDAWVRMYDRRKLSIGQADVSCAVRAYCPAHMRPPFTQRTRHRMSYCTSVDFSSDGRFLLAK